ncbi:hypothetical protein IAR55_005694 [Kwoniella newhampshirensis]|uniref:Uncharacterized protein n=1 Tax=Kwoniella newhampshirensis TaxID=1651941 RepID=A0AAW0YVC2_9TREE
MGDNDNANYSGVPPSSQSGQGGYYPYYGQGNSATTNDGSSGIDPHTAPGSAASQRYGGYFTSPQTSGGVYESQPSWVQDNTDRNFSGPSQAYAQMGAYSAKHNISGFNSRVPYVGVPTTTFASRSGYSSGPPYSQWNTHQNAPNTAMASGPSGFGTRSRFPPGTQPSRHLPPGDERTGKARSDAKKVARRMEVEAQRRGAGEAAKKAREDRSNAEEKMVGRLPFPLTAIAFHITSLSPRIFQVWKKANILTRDHVALRRGG